MNGFRALILGACAMAAQLAVGAAWAADPAGQPITLYNAAGHPVAVLTPLHADAVPAMQMMDAQQAAFGGDPGIMQYPPPRAE